MKFVDAVSITFLFKSFRMFVFLHVCHEFDTGMFLPSGLVILSTNIIKGYQVQLPASFDKQITPHVGNSCYLKQKVDTPPSGNTARLFSPYSVATR